jgi:hypothetical protein
MELFLAFKLLEEVLGELLVPLCRLLLIAHN